MQQVLSSRINTRRRRLVMALPLLGVGASTGWAAAPGGAHRALRTSHTLMGTRVDIAVEGMDAATLRHATELAVREMRRLEALMSRYQPGNLLSRINAAAGGRPVAVPPDVMAVLRSAQQLAASSGGAFDVTVGALRSWNFAVGQTAMPSAGEIARQLPLVGAHGLVLDARASTAFLTRAGMALDLGGVAKLPILDAGLRVLRNAGVPGAMVNGGGDVLTHGSWQGRPWRVGLRDPRAPERLLGVVHAAAGATVVASSGDYERYFFRDGQRMHHVLNPRTGRPTTGVHGVSLVAADVATVNGLGAALMVRGLAAGKALAARTPQLPMLIAGYDGTVWQSPAMAGVLQPLEA